MTFGAHKLVRSKPFLDSQCELWQLLPALYSDMCSISETAILSEINVENRIKIDPQTATQWSFELRTPSNAQPAGSERDKKLETKASPRRQCSTGRI